MFSRSFMVKWGGGGTVQAFTEYLLLCQPLCFQILRTFKGKKKQSLPSRKCLSGELISIKII